jgi:cephalosporin-C deacetylase-like acetyl esterase
MEFWSAQKAELAEVPIDAKVKPVAQENPNVELFEVSFANIGGRRSHGYLAKPKGASSLPIMISQPGMGVHPNGLKESRWVIGNAALGFLALDMSAHDMPMERTPEDEARWKKFMGYPYLGSDDRMTYYYRQVFLGVIRGIDYMTSRSDWNRKAIISSGASQGGGLALIAAALDSRVTAVVAIAPALGEHTGPLFGRPDAAPNNLIMGPDKKTPDPRIIAATAYYDTVNFARFVKVPVLMSSGLIDTACPPMTVLSIYNTLSCPKQIDLVPLLGHNRSRWFDGVRNSFLAEQAGISAPAATPPTSGEHGCSDSQAMKSRLLFSCALLMLLLTETRAAALTAPVKSIHVSPAGHDANPGSADKPLATLSAAQRAARAAAGREPVTVLLHTGIYYLSDTIQFTAADSGTAEAPVLYAAAPGEQPIISGGARLKLEWTPFRDGIFQAKIPAGLVMDQMFMNGQRQPMARYPNYDPKAEQFNGAAADAIAPERVARWADPAGGIIHAMHTALWGDMHWRIQGKKPDGSLDYEGGWQNNRPSEMHKKFRMVENIREELDAPGEWFHDTREGKLYFFPPAGADLQTAIVEVVRLRHLVEFNGTPEQPVRFITLRGLTFRHTARTFMENREPLLRSDWTVYRGGAVVFNGAEDATVADCDFDQVGGNAVFVSNYNRRITVRGCLIRESGANGIAFIGDSKAVRSPLFNYEDRFDYAKLDRKPGPLTDNFPANCLVEDCLITRSGRFEKQTAPVEIDMAQDITVRHCSIYDVPRAGINIGDGCWGGHVIEGCDVFDTVLETGDHGSFNSWGRDRYWHRDVRVVDKEVAADPGLPLLDVVRPNILRHNRWRCDHGWDVDLDDGSSRYEIYNNLFLNGGLKLREGYGRTVTNNVIVNNSLHPHVWFENSGDVFSGNIVMGAYRPAGMKIAKWGQAVDRNFFVSGVQLGAGQFGAWAKNRRPRFL